MKRLHAALLGSLSLVVLALPAQAATAVAKPATKPAAAATPAAPAVDPAATTALDHMGTYLRTLKEFDVTVYSTTEDVLESGQKIMTNNQVRYVVQGGKLHAIVSGDKIKRHYYFDGKTFTVRNNQNDFYAQVPFTGTITQLLDEVEKYDVDLPLQDLFRWGSPAGHVLKPTAGIVIGDSKVVDWDTDHYAFRQEGVDYQVWIEKGEKPLPRKLVINSLADQTQPQYTAVLNWNLSPKVDAAEFTFVPDANAKKIPFMTAEVYAAATAAKKPAK